MRTVDPAAALTTPRPLYCTEPVIRAGVALTPGQKLGVYCVDTAGNRGEVVWTEVLGKRGTLPRQELTLWVAPPTAQVKRDAEAPAERTTRIEFAAMPGEAKGFQVCVRPERDLRQTRVVLGAMQGPEGATSRRSGWRITL